jgi:hypothetical protein
VSSGARSGCCAEVLPPAALDAILEMSASEDADLPMTAARIEEVLSD